MKLNTKFHWVNQILGRQYYPNIITSAALQGFTLHTRKVKGFHNAIKLAWKRSTAAWHSYIILYAFTLNKLYLLEKDIDMPYCRPLSNQQIQFILNRSI